MKIKSLVEKMGGVQRFTFEPLIPTSRKSMSKFLDITKEEFSDYLDYLELFGGETGFIKEFKLPHTVICLNIVTLMTIFL